MAEKQIETVALDPAVWARGYLGNATDGSYTVNTLLFEHNGQRRQCCIGVACTALGIPDEAIRDRCSAESINAPIELPAAIARLAALRERVVGVYMINDDSHEMSDEERVTRINADLARHSVPLRFCLKVRRAKAEKPSKAKRAKTTAASEAL